jgi:hypothetical protein
VSNLGASREHPVRVRVRYSAPVIAELRGAEIRRATPLWGG